MADKQPTYPSAEANFETLFARYGASIYHFCLRLSRNPSDAEDLTQEVFVAAFLGQTRFEGRASLTTYLYRIAVFRWRLLREKQSRSGYRTAATADAAGDRADASAPDVAATAIDRVDLDAALQTLDERHRTAFLLVKGEGMTCREASAILRIPEGTVKFHVYCAVRHLQEALAKGDVAAAPERRAAARRGGTHRKPASASAGETCHEL